MTDQARHGDSQRLTIVQADDGHAGVIAEFIREVWTPSATTASVAAARTEAAARNVAEPGVAPPTWIALKAGRVIGYVTTIPVRLWDGARDWPAYWIKGLMVLPEFQGGPIGYHLLKAAAAALPRSGGLAVAAPARRLFEALGYQDLGALPNWIRPIAPGRLLHRLDPAALGLEHLSSWAGTALRVSQTTGVGPVLGWAAGVTLRAGAAVGRINAYGLDTGPFHPDPVAVELDQLWEAARGQYHSAVTRDADYLLSRYATGAESPYSWLAARRRGALVGVAILRQPRADGDERLKGIRIATLADLLYQPHQPAVGLALLGGVERAARGLGADAILASASAPAFQRLLRRQLFLPLSGNVHFLFRDVAGESPRFGPALPDWWLSRGDGQADETF